MSKKITFCLELVNVLQNLIEKLKVTRIPFSLFIYRNGTASMNGPGDIPDPTEQNPCGITSFFPLGMSCRGRAEAFARSLQSRLRTLGTQVRHFIFLIVVCVCVCVLYMYVYW